MTRDSKPWTTAEIAAVKTMTEAGMSAREIAAKLPGRTRNAITGLRQREIGPSVWLIGHDGEAIIYHQQRSVAIKRACAILNQDRPEPPWYPQEVACMCRRIPVAELSQWTME